MSSQVCQTRTPMLGSRATCLGGPGHVWIKACMQQAEEAHKNGNSCIKHPIPPCSYFIFCICAGMRWRLSWLMMTAEPALTRSGHCSWCQDGWVGERFGRGSSNDLGYMGCL